MDVYNWNFIIIVLIIYDWWLVHDNIDIGAGKWVLIGDKVAPYGVVTKIIFVYEKGGGLVDVWWYLYEVVFVLYGYLYWFVYNRMVLSRRGLCRYSWTNISVCRRRTNIIYDGISSLHDGIIINGYN